MNQFEGLLKNILGQEGLESLSKAMARKGSHVVDPQDLYLPLMVIPRAILSWLVQNIKPIKPGEHKELDFPGKDEYKIHIEKMQPDIYRGEIREGSKIIHTFEHQSLPSIGGHLMTVGELYDDISDLDDKKDKESVADLARDILDRNDFFTSPKHVESIQDNSGLKSLADSIGKLVDALVAKNADKVSKEEMRPQTYKEPVKDQEIQAVKHPKQTHSENQQSKRTDPTIDRDNPYNKAELPGGAAMPKPPEPPQRAPAASKNPSKAQQQTMASAQGKQLQTKQPKTPKGPGLANKPQGMPEQSIKSDDKIELDPTKKPNKSGYFKKKIRKNEKKVFNLSKEEVYSNCPFCGTPIFVEENSKPKFNPCMCYTAMTKTEDGNDIWFVRISKLNKGGYQLKFNPKADPESVKAFLVTMKHRLLSKKGE